MIFSFVQHTTAFEVIDPAAAAATDHICLLAIVLCTLLAHTCPATRHTHCHSVPCDQAGVGPHRFPQPSRDDECAHAGHLPEPALLRTFERCVPEALLVCIADSHMLAARLSVRAACASSGMQLGWSICKCMQHSLLCTDHSLVGAAWLKGCMRTWVCACACNCKGLARPAQILHRFCMRAALDARAQVRRLSTPKSSCATATSLWLRPAGSW